METKEAIEEARTGLKWFRGVLSLGRTPPARARKGSEVSEKESTDRVQVIPRGTAIGAQVTRQGEERKRKKRARK